MRKAYFAVMLVAILAFIGCGQKRFHQGAMPDPEPYMIHFHELDADGDDAVTWEEFQSRFPETNEHVFRAVDQDGDGLIDHDEWHAFKKAHG